MVIVGVCEVGAGTGGEDVVLGFGGGGIGMLMLEGGFCGGEALGDDGGMTAPLVTEGAKELFVPAE